MFLCVNTFGKSMKLVSSSLHTSRSEMAKLFMSFGYSCLSCPIVLISICVGFCLTLSFLCRSSAQNVALLPGSKKAYVSTHLSLLLIFTGTIDSTHSASPAPMKLQMVNGPLSKALYNLCLSFTHSHTHSHTNGDWLPCKVPTSLSGTIGG